MTQQERNEAAERFYKEGNQYRQQNDWQHALECYNQAIELNPESPASKAKEMLENILNFYCKEMFNP